MPDRPRNGRPRDELGRPLPYGAAGVERQPEGVVRSPAETVAEARALLVAGRPFHAHEVFEDAWKATDGPQREVWRALAQLAVGMTHAARGNRAGAVALLARGADGLAPFAGTTPFGLDVDALRRWAADAGRVAASGAKGQSLPVPPLG